MMSDYSFRWETVLFFFFFFFVFFKLVFLIFFVFCCAHVFFLVTRYAVFI